MARRIARCCARHTVGRARRTHGGPGRGRLIPTVGGMCLAYSRDRKPDRSDVAGTGLSTDPKEYRHRLADQSDDRIDAWAAEMMRDVAKRRGVIRVLTDLRKAADLSEADIERVFASGSGPMASLGRDAQGRQMIPAVALYALVPGIRLETPNGRDRLIDYLVENFDELVYV